MRDVHTPLIDVIDSFLTHRHDLSGRTALNYQRAITAFAHWCEQSLGRPAEVADIEPGTVDGIAYVRCCPGPTGVLLLGALYGALTAGPLAVLERGNAR